MQVGSYVVLKSPANINEIVVTGILDDMDNIRVNGATLGPDFCQVVIQYQVQKNARLVFPYNHIQTIGDALGVPVPWPLSLVRFVSLVFCNLFHLISLILSSMVFSSFIVLRLFLYI